jgi:hypothetical protein
MIKFIEGLFLSDHEWKKKYCPHLYNYLFLMNDEKRHNLWVSYWEASKKIEIQVQWKLDGIL